MKDGYGRTIDYLRISITDRCNLRCTYCMPEEGIPCLAHGDILTYEEIETICRAMAQIGLKHVRITGGEPLVRRQCWRLVKKLRRVPGLQTVTLTTNGILLEEQAQQLVAAGLDGVNISLDTLDAAVYRSITRCGDVSRVLAGLEQMQKYPQVTVKLNCVLGGVQWEQTAVAVAGLAKRCPVHVRFIERMPMGCGKDFGTYLPSQAVLDRCPELEPISHDGVAACYRLPDAKGTVGLIAPMSHAFCAECSRIRITADGKLKPCLHSDAEITLRGLSGEELEQAIRRGILMKPERHHMDETGVTETHRGMFAIGG